MRRARFAVALGLAVALPAAAGDFDQAGSLTQSQFSALAQDLGAAFAYKGVTPATDLGPLGFDVGVEVTDTRLKDVGAFRAAGNDASDHLLVPKLHLHKGLWGGLDIGAFVGKPTQVGATLYGAELRYAIVRDGLAAPGIALRASASRATGMGPLRVDTAALDAMVSKRFTAVTPYAGAGLVHVSASVADSTLARETLDKGRVFAGLNLNLLAANLAFEAESLGGVASLSAKVGFRF